jgi:hypothetical protein
MILIRLLTIGAFWAKENSGRPLQSANIGDLRQELLVDIFFGKLF